MPLHDGPGASLTTTSAHDRLGGGHAAPWPEQKPRSWGEHALWVGNIPPHTTVMALRDYFSAATNHPSLRLLSISYNPDARYAFVNFGDEAARAAAVHHAASCLFDGRRLDCRIRRDSTSRSTKVRYNLGRRRDHHHRRDHDDRRDHPPAAPTTHAEDGPASLRHKVDELARFPEADGAHWGTDKYYIIKSFSAEALHQSIQRGVWCVPNRHVDRLNQAFQSSRTVYLIFSVNGSGAFSGYATMRAEIPVDTLARPSTDNDVHQRFDLAVPDTDPPECERDTPSHGRSRASSRAASDDSSSSSSSISTSTPSSSFSATSTVGAVYYEPDRRRIVWEASSRAPVAEPALKAENLPTPARPPPPAAPFSPWSPSAYLPPSHTSESDSLLARLERFSSPCRIRWRSTRQVPFDQVRGLQNAWNEHKDIQVARNVTAIEPAAGAALLRCWQDPAAVERWTHSRDAIAVAWPSAV